MIEVSLSFVSSGERFLSLSVVHLNLFLFFLVNFMGILLSTVNVFKWGRKSDKQFLKKKKKLGVISFFFSLK